MLFFDVEVNFLGFNIDQNEVQALAACLKDDATITKLNLQCMLKALLYENKKAATDPLNFHFSYI